MSLWGLFFLFMYIGFATIGGGLVSISLMQQELIPRALISAEKFMAMIAVSESTPGPIGINMATYIGYELYGITGSIILTAGIVFPSLVIIILIAHFEAAITENMHIQRVLYGLRAGAAGMIAAAAWKVIVAAVFTLPLFYATRQWSDLCNWKAAALFAGFTGVQIVWKKLHPLMIILAGALFGILIF
ncbi:MAG: chromate transporter [Treponema sp.]